MDEKPPPLQTGRADFPHPAFPVVSSSGYRSGFFAFRYSFFLKRKIFSGSRPVFSANASGISIRFSVLSVSFCKRDMPLSESAYNRQGSFAPQALLRFNTTMNPSDSLPDRGCGSFSRILFEVTASGRQGLPSSESNFRRVLSAITPRSRASAFNCLFPARAGFTIPEKLATPALV